MSSSREIDVNAWVLRGSSGIRPRLRLFCFPYAGGAAAIYRAWSGGLPAEIEVCAVQLPGRGGRFREAPFTRLPDLARAAARALGPRLDVPFALFGHSMGALIAFEVARELRRIGPAPVHLLVSAHEAPHRPDPDPPISHLDDADFVAEICARYDGIPREVLEQPELMALVLPAMRADFTAIENYRYVSEPPLDCPISCFGGTGDKRVALADLEAWSEQTTGSFRLRVLPGDHFFVDSARHLLLAAIAEDLGEASADLEARRA